MRSVWCAFRWMVAMALASAVTIVPACGTMGGGGMRYLTDPAPASATATV